MKPACAFLYFTASVRNNADKTVLINRTRASVYFFFECFVQMAFVNEYYVIGMEGVTQKNFRYAR